MNSNFNFKSTEIEGLFLINTFRADDERGYFIKDYSLDTFEANKVEYLLKETFYSFSKKGVIRGLHIQRGKEQGKLVRCISGHIWDVVVDIRPNSSTYLKWLSFDLTSENNKELLIPIGCLHGFIALEDSIVSYKCDECFYPEGDGGIRWNDDTIGIQWPCLADENGNKIEPIISQKDSKLPYFAKCGI